MARSLFDQDLQVRASTTYGESVSDAHTIGVAQGQTTLEGDLNVLRTLTKDLLGEAHWYTVPAMSMNGVAYKKFINAESIAAFTDVASGTGTSSIAFDAAIKTISGHNEGLGSDTVEGVIVNNTLAHHLEIRENATGHPVDDGEGNSVYGKLAHSTTIVEAGDDSNQLSGYASISGVTMDNTGPGKMLWISVVDDTGGYFHVDIYKNSARSQLVAHTGTYNSTGSQALIEDNTSGIGGAITIDAVGPADTDISIRFGTYTIYWFSNKSGTETAYSFTGSVDIDLSAVLVTRAFKNLPWERYLDLTFHDTSGFLGTIADTAVTVSGMAYLLNGLSTQHQINVLLDKLGHKDTNGEGAHYIAINDSATGGSDGYWTAEYLQGVLNEIKTQIGGATSATYNFTGGTGSVLTDNDYVYPALNKLDQAFVDLQATTSGNGASMVGIYDGPVSHFIATDVEGALAELWSMIQDVGAIKVTETTSGIINSGVSHTLPGSLTYTPATYGANLDVYYQGQLLMVGQDYTEDAGAPSTSIKFLFTVPTGRNLTYVARK